jgi:hypothetical protein
MAQKYKLASDNAYGWYTGVMKDGNQALLGLDINAEICVVFDLDGRMIHTIERCFDQNGTPSERPITDWPFFLTDLGRQKVEQRFHLWLRETIASEQPIIVQEFDIAERFIGIEPMPGDYIEFLDNPDSVDEEDRPELAAIIDDWKARGFYVFWWNEYYWMNPDGSVNSH